MAQTHTILGKQVGAIGYGMMGLTVAPVPHEKAFAAIKAALDSGCNYFNAGEFYGPPERNSMTLLNAYLAKYPEDADRFLLNVKGGHNAATATPTGDRESIHASIDNCIRMLGPLKRIDQFEPARKDMTQDYNAVTLQAVKDYVDAGKVGAISCSEINVDTLRSAAKVHKITSLEIELSLFTRAPLDDGLLAACAELDIPVLAYSPLGGGFLGGNYEKPEDIPKESVANFFPRYQGDNFYKNRELVYKVKELASKKGCTPGQIAIGWIIALSKRPGMPIIIPIPGSSNPDRIRENATIVQLDEADMAEIDKILAGFVHAGERYPPNMAKHLNL